MDKSTKVKNSFAAIVETKNSPTLLFEFDPIYLKERLKYSIGVFENGIRISSFNMEMVSLEWRIVKAPLVEARLLALEPFFNEKIKAFLCETAGKDNDNV